MGAAETEQGRRQTFPFVCVLVFLRVPWCRLVVEQRGTGREGRIAEITRKPMQIQLNISVTSDKENGMKTHMDAIREQRLRPQDLAVR